MLSLLSLLQLCPDASCTVRCIPSLAHVLIPMRDRGKPPVLHSAVDTVVSRL